MCDGVVLSGQGGRRGGATGGTARDGVVQSWHGARGLVASRARGVHGPLRASTRPTSACPTWCEPATRAYDAAHAHRSGPHPSRHALRPAGGRVSDRAGAVQGWVVHDVGAESAAAEAHQRKPRRAQAHQRLHCRLEHVLPRVVGHVGLRSRGGGGGGGIDGMGVAVRSCRLPPSCPWHARKRPSRRAWRGRRAAARRAPWPRARSVAGRCSTSRGPGARARRGSTRCRARTGTCTAAYSPRTPPLPP